MDYDFKKDELIIKVDNISNLSKLNLDFDLKENSLILFDGGLINYSIIDLGDFHDFEILWNSNYSGEDLKIIAKFEEKQVLPYVSYKISFGGIIFDEKIEFDLHMPNFFPESIISSRGIEDYKFQPSKLELTLDNSSYYKFIVVSRKDATTSNLLISLGISILAGMIVLLFQFLSFEKN